MMNEKKIKRIGSIVLISIGAIALVSEISAVSKNYYIQSAGIVLLMFGLFTVNSTVKPKSEDVYEEYFEEEE